MAETTTDIVAKLPSYVTATWVQFASAPGVKVQLTLTMPPAPLAQ